MTYALAAPLQEAVFQHLAADSGVIAELGGAIYDALPTGSLPETYAVLGGEDVLDRSDATGAGARHQIQISLYTSAAGFAGAKTAEAAICDALQDTDLTLSRGRLIGIGFEKATAERLSDGTRSIVLRFAARVEDD